MSTIKANAIVDAAGTGAPTLTNGAVLPAGSAAAPAISPTGDSNTGIFFPAADTIAFAEGGAEAMRVDSSGNVGIGTSSPSKLLHTYRNNTDQSAQVQVEQAGSGSPTLGFLKTGVYAWMTGLYNSDNSYRIAASGTDLNTTTRLTIDTSGNLLFNSGYGSVATAYGCRAWVNFNGTGTVAIRASGNVSSITDNGTGDYTVNFTTAMPDADYSVTGMVGITALVRLARYNSLTTSQIQNITVVNTSNSATDAAAVTIAVFR